MARSEASGGGQRGEAGGAQYRLEWQPPDRAAIRGEPVAYRPVPIRSADQEEWLREVGRSGGGISISMEVENGQAQLSFGRGGGTRADGTGAYQWPSWKPAFFGGRIPIHAVGRAWVRRHLPAGGPGLYDVFDRAGRRVGQVTLESGRRIVGFGLESVYVVAADEFDLNYLERYPMPRF